MTMASALVVLAVKVGKVQFPVADRLRRLEVAPMRPASPDLAVSIGGQDHRYRAIVLVYDDQSLIHSVACSSRDNPVAICGLLHIHACRQSGNL